MMKAGRPKYFCRNPMFRQKTKSILRSNWFKWTCILLCLAAVGIYAVRFALEYGEGELDRLHGIPSKADVIKSIRNALDDAEQMELLSLDPAVYDAQGFASTKVLGKVAITDKKQRQRISSAILQGIKKHDGISAACFEPRHGISCYRNGSHISLQICFECSLIRVNGIGPSYGAIGTSSSAEPLLNGILTDAAIPLGPK